MTVKAEPRDDQFAPFIGKLNMPAIVLGEYQDTAAWSHAHRHWRSLHDARWPETCWMGTLALGGNHGQLPALDLFGFLFLATAGGSSFSVNAILARQERD